MKKQNEFIIISFLILVTTFLALNIQNIDTNVNTKPLEIIALLTAFALSVLFYFFVTAIKKHLYIKTKLKIRDYLNIFDTLVISVVVVILYMFLRINIYTVTTTIIVEIVLMIIYIQKTKPYISKISDKNSLKSRKNNNVSNNLEDYDDLTLGEASQYGINNILNLKQSIYNCFLEHELSFSLNNLNYKDCKIISVTKNEDDLLIDAILKISYIDLDKEKNNIYKINLSKSSILRRNEECPNCGARMKTKGTDKCPYCKTIIVSLSDSLVINKIIKKRK